MRMKKRKNQQQGPSSSIGIMKFKEGSGGPQLSPELVIAFAVGLSVLVLILRWVFNL